MAMPRGFRLVGDQSWSTRHPGYIECGGDVLRKPYEYRGNTRSQYFVAKACSTCGASILTNKSNHQRYTNSFCSVACKKAGMNAASAGNKAAKRRPHGQGHHVLVRNHEHPRRGRHNQVYEHTLVMEEAIGRYVTPDERVHHINCVKDDNRLENLFLCANNTEHFRIHGSLNACVAALIERGALYFDRDSKSYRVRDEVQP